MSTDAKFGMLLGLALVIISAVFAASQQRANVVSREVRVDPASPRISLPETAAADWSTP